MATLCLDHTAHCTLSECAVVFIIKNLFMCVCVCIGKMCMHVFMWGRMPVCACEGQRSLLDVFLHCSTPYFQLNL